MAQRSKAFLVIACIGAALLLGWALFESALPVSGDGSAITKSGVPAESGAQGGTSSTRTHEETPNRLTKEALAAELRPIEEWLYGREQERTKMVQRIESEFMRSVFVRVEPPDSREVEEAYGQLETRLKRFGAKSANGQALWREGAKLVDEYVKFPKPYKFVRVLKTNFPTPRLKLSEYFVDDPTELRMDEHGGLSLTLSDRITIRDDIELASPNSWAAKRYPELLQMTNTIESTPK